MSVHAVNASALDPDQIESIVEWARILDEPGRAAELTAAAADWHCDERTGWLRLLYRLVAEAVRVGDSMPRGLAATSLLLASARAAGNPGLERFCARADALLADPERFDRHRWCDGGFVFEDTLRENEPAVQVAAALLSGRVDLVEGSRRIATLVRHSPHARRPELAPFLQLDSGHAGLPIGPARRKALAETALDADGYRERILDACRAMVAEGGLAPRDARPIY